MTVASELFDRLTNHPTFAALASTRVYPLKLPQGGGVLPAVAYQRISTRPIGSHQGAALSVDRWQFTAWAIKYLDAAAVGEAIKAALNGWRGDDEVTAAMLAGGTETTDPDTGWAGVTIELYVWHREPVAA